LPPRQAGSLRTISRCSERSEMANGLAAVAPEIDTMLRATPGNWAAKARTVMPPIEGPATQATVSMPSWRSTS